MAERLFITADSLDVPHSIKTANVKAPGVGKVPQGISKTCEKFLIEGDTPLFWRGTFLPFLRALDRPMAMAWRRLFTLPP